MQRVPAGCRQRTAHRRLGRLRPQQRAGRLADARGADPPARHRGLHPGLRARDAVDHGHAHRRGGPGRG